MNAYDELRSLGVSVETADAIAPIIDALTPKKRKAFFLWLQGERRREICNELHISSKTMTKMIQTIKQETKNV